MKSFIPLDENVKEKANIIDFLDSLDTDATSKLEPENTEVEEKQDTEKSETIEKNPETSEQECTALVVTKPNSLFVAQKMFKKSIKISIKSFLISISLGFLNLFI